VDVSYHLTFPSLTEALLLALRYAIRYFDTWDYRSMEG